MAIPCRLTFGSNSPHLQQLFTGFSLLHRRGVLRLSQHFGSVSCDYGNSAPHLRDARHAHLDALVDRRLRLHFDTHDAKEIATGAVERCDFYFKRSYLRSEVDLLPEGQRGKIFPLGLNYLVLPDTVDRFAAYRALRLGCSRSARGLRSGLQQAFDVKNRLGHLPRLGQMSSTPDYTAAPKVLFMVALYDPYDDSARAASKIEERRYMNETRVQCLKILKAELGSRFTGGLSRSRYSLEHHPELVLPDALTEHKGYLRTLSSFSICVATTGLHGSSGWKLAEYVAFSKAIVSEPPLYDVPGGFAAERHFLAFSTPEQCVSATVRLIEDEPLRRALMRENSAYYQAYVKPDALVSNALYFAMQASSVGTPRPPRMLSAATQPLLT